MSTPLPTIEVAVWAGQPIDLLIPVYGADGVVLTAADVASARAQVRSGPTGGSLLYEFDADNGATITAEGLVRIVATGAQTAEWATLWADGGGWWDVEATDTGGGVHPISAPARFTIASRITR